MPNPFVDAVSTHSRGKVPHGGDFKGQNTVELFKANAQWSTRPADEKFGSVAELLQATTEYASTAAEADVQWADLRTEAIDGSVRLTGKTEQPARLTHWSFGQLAKRVSAPAEYLRALPATLASQNLNHGLAARGTNPAGPAQLLVHQNGSLLVRAVTSDKYARIWNYEVAQRLLNLGELGWEPATPDIRATKENDTALYASDHDMFAFLRNSELSIEEKGSSGAMYRGVIVENSEVGAAALKLTRFLYREMCGNHIIWGASEVMDFSIRHVGEIREKMRRWEVVLNEYANESSSLEEAQIAQAQTMRIADTKEGVLDKLFGIKGLGITRKQIDASYEAVNTDQDGDPRTVWGFAQGVTRYSQTLPHADKRNDIDRAAGKILKIAF